MGALPCYTWRYRCGLMPLPSRELECQTLWTRTGITKGGIRVQPLVEGAGWAHTHCIRPRANADVAISYTPRQLNHLKSMLEATSVRFLGRAKYSLVCHSRVLQDT